MVLFFKSVGQYRSSLYETARGLLRSRNNQRERAEELALQTRKLELRNEHSPKNCRKWKDNLIKPTNYYVNYGRKTKSFDSSRSGCRVISRCRIIPTVPR